jgi:DNA-binding CsgD family transcriptional regulator
LALLEWFLVWLFFAEGLCHVVGHGFGQVGEHGVVAGLDQAALSEYEKCTLCLISEGLTNREIGEKLAVAEKTVQDNVTDIFRKLKARNRAEAALVVEQVWGGFQSRAKLH